MPLPLTLPIPVVQTRATPLARAAFVVRHVLTMLDRLEDIGRLRDAPDHILEVYEAACASSAELLATLLAAAPAAVSGRCPRCDEFLCLAGRDLASEQWLAFCAWCEEWAMVPPSGSPATALDPIDTTEVSR